ncbi:MULTISPECIES: DMT family transporter [unclassified Acinetobacter]|uniref:EamA family transporter n=1 Tax=unclassified Acinetobacter TaxID=196816 RepID=UPI0035B95B5B
MTNTSQTKTVSTTQAVIFIFLSVVSMQSSSSLAKTLFAHFPEFTVSLMRLCFGALLLALVFRAWQIDWSKVRWRAILMYGASIAGMNLMFYLAIKRLPLGIAVSLEFIGPLSVALFHARQKIDIVWVICAVLGLILLFPQGELHQLQHGLDPWGVFFALGAGTCWGIYMIVGKNPTGVSNMHTVTLGMAVAFCCVLPVALWHGIPTELLNWHFLALFVALGALASAIPFALDIVALKSLSPLLFGILCSTEPAFAALSGLIFLQEKLLWTQSLAILVLVIASIGCTYTTHRAKVRSEQAT